MNKKKLLSLVDFLINSYKSSLSSSKIVKALIDSNSFSFIGKAIEEDVLVNNLSISNALRKKNLLPLSFVNILSACENSGRFVEILQSYSKILQDAIKIEEELRNQKLYFSFILFVFMIGTIIFYFVFNNVTTSLVENKDFFAFKII
jgi:type II secretory pathway component PulF